VKKVEEYGMLADYLEAPSLATSEWSRVVAQTTPPPSASPIITASARSMSLIQRRRMAVLHQHNPESQYFNPSLLSSLLSQYSEAN